MRQILINGLMGGVIGLCTDLTTWKGAVLLVAFLVAVVNSIIEPDK